MAERGHRYETRRSPQPAKLILRPWQASPIELASAGITLGKTYPQPVIDHAKGRERALAAYATIRRG